MTVIWFQYGGTGIIMDGATPIVKRGKERQTPKKKKPTLLKKVSYKLIKL